MPLETGDLVERYKKLKETRFMWEDHWQRLAELMLPRKADFTTERTPGERRTDQQYDGTPMMAARMLATSLDGLLKPKTSKWFMVKASDEDLNDNDEIKLWLADVEKRMYSAIYNRNARFIHASGEVDIDLVVFGTGNLFIGETADRRSLLFKALHLKDCFILRNSDGMVDTVFIHTPLTVRQAQQKFKNPGPTAKKFDISKSPDKIIEYIQVIGPKNEIGGKTPLPYASRWIDVESKEEIIGDDESRGFHEFPVMVPVWDSAAGEDYGRSPGMLALPDSNTLMEQGKTILKAGHKAVDPPLMAAADSVIGSVRTWPGGLTYFDAEVSRMLGGRSPITPLLTGANIPLGREMQNDTRNQIWMAFFKHVLSLPLDRPQMTATEVLERKEEFIRTIGPVFGRLESDYTGPMIDRVFNIMFRAGSFPEAPRILKGRDIRFEYASPIDKARKQIEAAAAARSAEVLAPYATTNPGILDNFDSDQIARDVAEANGMPLKWLRTTDAVKRVREGRMQAQQNVEQMARMQATVDMGTKIAQAQAQNKMAEGKPA